MYRKGAALLAARYCQSMHRSSIAAPSSRWSYLRRSGPSSGWVLYLGALFSERHGLGTGEVGLVYLASGIGYLAGSAAAGSWLGGSAPRATYAATTIGSGALFGLAFAAPFGTGAAVACITLASFLAPFGWVTLAAMLSGETPAGRRRLWCSPCRSTA